jgi:hypothetical protein
LRYDWDTASINTFCSWANQQVQENLNVSKRRTKKASGRKIYGLLGLVKTLVKTLVSLHSANHISVQRYLARTRAVRAAPKFSPGQIKIEKIVKTRSQAIIFSQHIRQKNSNYLLFLSTVA